MVKFLFLVPFLVVACASETEREACPVGSRYSHHKKSCVVMTKKKPPVAILKPLVSFTVYILAGFTGMFFTRLKTR